MDYFYKNNPYFIYYLTTIIWFLFNKIKFICNLSAQQLYNVKFKIYKL